MLNLLRSLARKLRPQSVYRRLALNQKEIGDEAYKQYLGGGAQEWDRRGEFQLYLLRRLGLEPQHRFLDIGCGPLRGGVHVIAFLNAGGYAGVDYNASFIEVAQRTITEKGLEAKRPAVEVMTGFQFPTADRFDYALAFSVLNHCSPEERAVFFGNIGPQLVTSGKAYITHARWWNRSVTANHPLRVSRVFSDLESLFSGEQLSDWGWSDETEIFPILEISPL